MAMMMMQEDEEEKGKREEQEENEEKKGKSRVRVSRRMKREREEFGQRRRKRREYMKSSRKTMSFEMSEWLRSRNIQIAAVPNFRHSFHHIRSGWFSVLPLSSSLPPRHAQVTQ